MNLLTLLSVVLLLLVFKQIENIHGTKNYSNKQYFLDILLPANNSPSSGHIKFSGQTSVNNKIRNKYIKISTAIFLQKINASSKNFEENVMPIKKDFDKTQTTNKLYDYLPKRKNNYQTIAEDFHINTTPAFQDVYALQLSYRNQLHLKNNTIEENGDTIPTSFKQILITKYKCSLIQNEILSVICRNVSLYRLVKYLPNYTEALQVSYSSTPILSKPLAPQLKLLKQLILQNNNHRYITKGFMGLEKLELLDLSFNSIRFIQYAFTYLPSLKVLILANNEIIWVGTIAKALQGNVHLEQIILDNNYKIGRILEKEFQPLENHKIKLIRLFNTTMKRIDEGAFQCLPYLESLDLSVNYLNEEALTNVTKSLVNSSIQALRLRALTLISSFPYESLSFLANTSIHYLDLSYNYFHTIREMPAIASLRHLWLSYCSTNYISDDAFNNMLNLEKVVLSGNDLSFTQLQSLKNIKCLIQSDPLTKFRDFLFRIPDFAFLNMSSLIILDFSINQLESILHRHTFYGLKNLEFLNLRRTHIKFIEDFSFESLASLRFLVLSDNLVSQLSNSTFFGLDNLTNLYLESNRIKFINDIYPFHFTPSLMIIILNRNAIENIPENLFAFNSYIEHLTLSSNKLKPWKKRIFHPNSTIVELNLSKNQIDNITPVMLSEFHQVIKYLNVKENPFNCSKCSMRKFKNFLASNLNLTMQNLNDKNSLINCAYPTNLRSQLLLETDTLFVCTVDESIISLFTIILLFLVVTFLVVTAYLGFFFRWYWKYWIFHMKSKIKERHSSGVDAKILYKYDAFVSYNFNDVQWIVSYLIPALEHEDPKLKLCIHERDFEVGLMITENILKAIENSRKVILVLTEDFIKSEWCMFELHMAQHRLFDDTRDSLILLKLKHINDKLYTKNLRYLEKTRPCFKWSNNLNGQKLFWDKTRKILGHPLCLNQC